MESDFFKISTPLILINKKNHSVWIKGSVSLTLLFYDKKIGKVSKKCNMILFSYKKNMEDVISHKI